MHLLARLTGDCHTSGLGGMLILPVAALLLVKLPSIIFEQPNHLTNLHPFYERALTLRLINSTPSSGANLENLWIENEWQCRPKPDPNSCIRPEA